MAKFDSNSQYLPLAGGLISLFLPGLGLLLSAEKKMAGIAIFVIAMVIDFLVVLFGAIGILLCLVGFMLWIIVPIVHVVAAIYTYDSLKKEQGLSGFIFN